MTDAPRAPRSPTLTEQQKKDWVINRQGKDYVLYAALLEIAHNQFGLSGISTTLKQIPGPENGHVAICTASVIVEHGVFSGIGDADPGNVSRMMANAIIRMAETRAKARALRDAINASAWAVDGDDDTGNDPAPKSSHQEASFTASGAPPSPISALSNGTTQPAPIPAAPLPETPTWPVSQPSGTLTPLPKPPSEPRGRSLTERATVPVNQDAGTVDLRTARAKWNATIEKANGLGVRIPVMTDAQMADVSELLVEGRKLGRAIRMKEQEQLGLTGEQRPGE